jgi:hypothetical protein
MAIPACLGAPTSGAPRRSSSATWSCPRGGRLIPIEIKHAASPQARDCRALETFLDDYPTLSDTGLLISMHPRVERISRRIYNVPLGLILHGL